MLLFAILSTFIVGDVKGQVAASRLELESASDKSAAQVKLAKALWQDQDQEGAFRVYLGALESADCSSVDEMGSDEQKAFNEAFALYKGKPPEEAAEYSRRIIAGYARLAELHPEWSRLGLLVALAEANLGEFDLFFDRFYNSYCRNPDHFLSLKTLAILHIKLLERAKSGAVREEERGITLNYLKRAADLCPEDLSLRRLEIAMSSPEERDKTVRQVLNKILSLTIIPSRVDTLYFVRLARSLNDDELLGRWVKKGLEWYPDSRSLKQLEGHGIKNTR